MSFAIGMGVSAERGRRVTIEPLTPVRETPLGVIGNLVEGLCYPFAEH